MYIKKITEQIRRDFTAVYECEHCGHTETAKGYDDDNFQLNVVPTFVCPKCGEVAPDTYRALRTKYPAHMEV